MENKYAIVAIGYNRVDSMLRLLKSLQNANYGEDTITLIVSIDNCGNDKVKKAVEKFEWEHGEKILRTFSKQQGLRKHILSCGEFLKDYDALFVFEDDVIVSPAFYLYGKDCIARYDNNDSIAGISLYALQWNQNANFPFSPMKTEGDTYFVQYAQSWGQIWLKNSFEDFLNWYNANLDFFNIENASIPSRLYTWGDNSWLKYHIAYCIKKNKYFVYPYYSLTTVFTEPGAHTDKQLTRFHTDMLMNGYKKGYKWAEFDNNAILYNAFLENINLEKELKDIYGENVLIDLYGCRKNRSDDKYVLSTQILPYKVDKKYAMQLRPIELNVYMDIEGEGIFLYNTSIPRKTTRREIRAQIVRKWDYFMKERFIMPHEIFPVCKEKLWNLLCVTFKMLKRRG